VIGLKEIQRRRLQFALIALVVALISYLVLMINGLGVGLNKQAGSALLQLDADAIAYSTSSRLSVIRSELSSQVVADVGQWKGVEASAPLGYMSVNTRSPEGEIDAIALLGYLPGQLGEPRALQGRQLTGNDRRGVLVDSKFLKLNGLVVGDHLTLVNRLQTYDFTVVGEVKDGYFFFQPVVYLLLDSLREVKYGTTTPDTPLASVVLVKGKGLEGARADGFEIVSKQTAFALRLFGFLIGALVIGIFFYVLTLQKIQQVGTLKALGASNGFLLRQMLLQVLTVIVGGVLISTGAAYGTFALLSRIPKGVPIAFTGGTFVITSSLFVATGLIGLFFSLRKVSRVDPIIAIGQQQ
jgi:putative ABC transport system permease protein